MEFLAALFDMDGTLIDSMGVWARVDEAFFARRNMALPADYARSISGLSFRQTAEYTKSRFSLPDSVDEIMDEWNRTCESAYRYEVPLKPGAKDYLFHLKNKGVKLAVATALPERLYRPVLVRTGVYSLFDAFASTDETGKSKRDGEIYRLAAKRLGIPCECCAVFEDILDGLLGAREAGMKAYCVRDDSAKKDEARAREICDCYVESFTDFL